MRDATDSDWIKAPATSRWTCSEIELQNDAGGRQADCDGSDDADDDNKQNINSQQHSARSTQPSDLERHLQVVISVIPSSPTHGFPVLRGYYEAEPGDLMAFQFGVAVPRHYISKGGDRNGATTLTSVRNTGRCAALDVAIHARYRHAHHFCPRRAGLSLAVDVDNRRCCTSPRLNHAHFPPSLHVLYIPTYIHTYILTYLQACRVDS